MVRTMIGDATNPGKYKIQGFVENLRNKRTMAFLVLRDGSGRMQVTVEKEKNPALAEIVDQLTVESTVSVEGEIVDNEFVKLNGREMLPTSIVIESIADAMPLLKDSNIDTRLDYRWIDLRSDRNQLIFKVQTLMMDAFRAFLIARGFIELHTPKLIGTASESGADVFELEYFDRKAYLTQSPQFYKQMAMAGGMERIFEVGPAFRAEKSHTRKHTTEFTSFDIEMSWIDSYADIMQIEAELLADALAKIKDAYGDEIEQLYGQKVVVPQLPFPQIKLSDLYAELKARYGLDLPEEERNDLTTEGEQLAYQYSMEVYGHEFLFVTDFPAEKRAFYHMRKDGVPQGFDLLWRGVEITTGAQREHRYDQLKAQAAEKGLGEDVRFYTEFFRYGCPPHGGFGFGVDRMTMMILDLTIKETMFLFRGTNRLTP